jgi:hypothetical protein
MYVASTLCHNGWLFKDNQSLGTDPMARKKTEKKKMTEAVEPKTRPVRLDLSQRVHKLLRIIAAQEDVSMASYARDLVEQHLEELAKKRGIKV